MLLLVLALACLGGAVFLIGQLATEPARLRQIAVSRASTYGRTILRRGDTRPFRERALLPLALRVAHGVLRLSPKTTVEMVTMKLISAGVSMSATTFLAVKGCAVLGGFIFGLFVGADFGGAGQIGRASCRERV